MCENSKNNMFIHNPDIVESGQLSIHHRQGSIIRLC